MYSRVRDQFSTSALILSIVALIFAATGGALAATNSGSENASSSKSKAKKGPRGPKGATGPAGPQGPAGPKGDAGAAGAAGTTGAAGTPGAPGQSAFVNEIELGEPTECAGLGGAEVGVQGTPGVEICNGAKGDQGDAGDPWTAGGILPDNATETGVWSFTAAETGERAAAPISFTIPLFEGLEAEKVHFQTDADFGTHCTGFIGEPTAPSGELCVYSEIPGAGVQNATFQGIFTISFGSLGTNTTGALLEFTTTGKPAVGSGAWALTG